MNLKQINRLSLSIVIFLFIIIVAQYIFQLPVIQNWINMGLLEGNSGIFIWTIVWALIVAECGFIPGSYVPILLFCMQTPMINKPWLFIIVMTSAVVVGRVFAYYVGKNGAGRLLRWSAGEDYKNWCDKLTGKNGKLIYAITVIAPGFPDFILALIAGAVDMNFWYYIIINALCKGLENIVLVFWNFYAQGFTKFIFIYAGIILLALITFIITKIKIEKETKNG